MDCKKRHYYTYELKKEIIQKLKDGIKRSDIQKEYGISLSSLSRWVCPPHEIIAKANEETVWHHPIQATPEVDGDGDDDEEIDRILDSYKKRKREDNDDNDDDKLNKKRRLNDDNEDEEAEDWNRLVNNYKVLRRKKSLSDLTEDDWRWLGHEYKELRKKDN